MSVQVSADDIAVMRQQGDLETFLQSLTGRAPARRTRPAPAAPERPGGRPGQWPAGCQRPGPIAPIPPDAVRAALDNYRAWLANGSPDGTFRCDCSGCRRTAAPTGRTETPHTIHNPQVNTSAAVDNRTDTEGDRPWTSPTR